MKKYLIGILTLVLLSNFLLPIDASATTLREYEQKVQEYTNEINSKNNDIAISKKKLDEIQKKIADYEAQIKAAEEETQRLEEEIQKNNEEIKRKNAESKKIIEYYQVSNGENAYLEYAFGATSITDMIYRMSIVEQLTEYNDRVMKELQALIDANKQKQEQLRKKQEEMKELNKKLAEEASKVKGSISTMEGMIPNLSGQLKYYQQRVQYYKSVGCEPDDRIGIDCDRPTPTGGNIVGANGFVFPVSPAYRITTGYYWYEGGHKGIDIGKYCGAPIQAVAAGRVYYVGSGKDNYGAKMVMIVHNYNGRLVYSQYAHLNGYAVSEGQDVYAGQTIGYMGNSGYSFGCHLHLEMSEDLGWDYPDPGNYYSYIRHIVNPYKYIPG